MKKVIFCVAMLALTASVAAQEKSVYFSYYSGINIIFLLYDDGKRGEVTINGKKFVGTIEEKCDIDNKIPCFCSGEKELFKFNGEDEPSFCSDGKQFMFFFEYDCSISSDRCISIYNQQYRFSAGTKGIDLLLIKQPNNMELLYSYGDDSYITGDISLMNDKAYYLEQLGAYAESIYILKKVLSKSPDRVVAYLNIADAYWGNNEKNEAKKSYEKYIELMKNQGKDMKKIPQRVYDRIKAEKK
jgi:tetratricopeptide (TPR) repeat protein